MLTSIKKEENSFRPLTGKLVLIVCSSVLIRRQHIGSFRPLTGKLVLICWKAGSQAVKPVTLCFRPLTGKLVLIVLDELEYIRRK